MRSAAVTIGAHRLGDMVVRLEQAADSGDASTCAAASAEITAELSTLESALRARFL